MPPKKYKKFGSRPNRALKFETYFGHLFWATCTHCIMSTAVNQGSKQKRKRSHYNVADLNQHMHRRNIYRNNRPDFKELAQQDLGFKP